MVKLFCAIVGIAGSAFPVKIGKNKFVYDLKNAIKRQKLRDLMNVDADELQLFLGKTGDGVWVSSNADAVIAMRSGVIPEQVAELLNPEMEIDPASKIGDVFGDIPESYAIQVLVVVPTQRQQLQIVDFQEPLEGIREAIEHSIRETIELSVQETVDQKYREAISHRVREAVDHKVREAVDHKVREGVDRLRKKQREAIRQDIDEAMPGLRHKASKSWSNRTLGEEEYRGLENDRLIIDIAPVESGEAFWPEKVQTKADAITTEAGLDALIVPYLNDVLGRCDMVFVKSADQWLSHSFVTEDTTDVQQYGFATHGSVGSFLLTPTARILPRRLLERLLRRPLRLSHVTSPCLVSSLLPRLPAAVSFLLPRSSKVDAGLELQGLRYLPGSVVSAATVPPAVGPD